ncbi:hypothetical protein EU545_02470, partial [Candidatus Thorarchaeota archaeon]
MFSCKKCGESLYIRNAEIKDRILTLDVQCLDGHKGTRRIAEHNVEDIAQDIFERMYICLECGSQMTLVSTLVENSQVEGVFLCPIHGIEKREFPRPYLPAVEFAGAAVDSHRSIIDSFRCRQCGL